VACPHCGGTVALEAAAAAADETDTGGWQAAGRSHVVTTRALELSGEFRVDRLLSKPRYPLRRRRQLLPRPQGPDPEEICAALDLDPQVPLVLCDARYRAAGRDVLPALVDHLMSGRSPVTQSR
jgi:hypothetical protein